MLMCRGKEGLVDLTGESGHVRRSSRLWENRAASGPRYSGLGSSPFNKRRDEQILRRVRERGEEQGFRLSTESQQ